MPNPDLSLLIPLYNEEECLIPNLGRLLVFLRARGLDAEVILGSNGSTDATAAIGRLLQEACPKRIRFFHLPERGIVGRVFKESVRLASAPHLVSVDADLSIDLDFIPRAHALLSTSDVVVGSKQSGSQARSLLRRIGSGAFILCAQLLLGLPYDDYSIGAKAYRKEIFDGWAEQMSDDTNYVMDILYHSNRKGLEIAVLPVECCDWRASRFRLLGEAFVKYTHLLRLFLSRSRAYL
jgi:glycosyltransferase involved in cell wall biosynthesis